MVDQRSVEMLAFNLASRFFAYRRLAEKQQAEQLHWVMIIPANQYRRAEATQLLAYSRPGGNGRQHTAHEVLNKHPSGTCELAL